MDRDLALFLGRVARQARKACGLTQANMAEQLDVSVEFYGRVERGVSLPSIETFVCMVELLDIRADLLLDTEALRTKMAASATDTAPAGPPELRELLPMLRAAEPGSLRVVHLLLDAIEQEREAREHAGGRGTRKSPPRRSGRGGSWATALGIVP